MAKTRIPQKVQSALWARSAGRCQYRGCNDLLIGDLIAGREDPLFGFIAHIVADAPNGPRGDPVRSPLLAKELSNLMLLCAKHHKLIDVDAEIDHGEELLGEMKTEHEQRVALLAGIDRDRASHVVRFGAAIGKNEALVSTRAIFEAMRPDHYPASAQTIDLEMTGHVTPDSESDYWPVQQANLQRQFREKLAGRIERQDIRHLSVFALAPQPLLMELGRLLCDIVPARIHQPIREPKGWAWPDDSAVVRFTSGEPNGCLAGAAVALKLAVSATVTDERIRGAIGDDAAIWTITAENPHNDIVRSPADQAAYRQLLRRTYDAIKARHGENAPIHVFPALPASLAIETGRVWMPKADLELLVYDQQPGRGFVPVLSIGQVRLG
jgi:hypothetical protein